MPNLTEAGSDAADVSARFLEPGLVAEAERDWEQVAPAIWRADSADGSWLKVRYAREDTWAEFVIDGKGDSVWVSRSPDVLVSEAASLLLGPMFSCLAAQRGHTCIHGAVVILGERVCAMVGPSGAGKSTTAYGLVRFAHGTLISDDVAVLSEYDGEIAVAQGPSRIRMREAPAMSLLGSFDNLEPVWAPGRTHENKGYLPIEPRTVTDGGNPLVLDVVYFLGPWGEPSRQPEIRPLDAVVALPRLMAQRHVVQAIGRASDRRDFMRFGRLLQRIPVKELVRPAGLSSVEQIVAAIVNDVRKV